jgi:hypothetical protein
MSALSPTGGHVASSPRVLMMLAALAYTIAVVLAIADTPPGTSYHAESGVATAADLAAGLALLAVGAAALWARARRHAGALAALAGVAWFAADWEAWSTGPALARAVGMLAAPLAVALLLHLVLAFPRARLDGAARALVAGVARRHGRRDRHTRRAPGLAPRGADRRECVGVRGAARARAARGSRRRALRGRLPGPLGRGAGARAGPRMEHRAGGARAFGGRRFDGGARGGAAARVAARGAGHRLRRAGRQRRFGRARLGIVKLEVSEAGHLRGAGVARRRGDRGGRRG